ncbi:hypothetical protein BKA67DRAFT_537680 [Truncatella angustata]|uniref:Uncharacterized protein n=1 Tax=Truncatella angustata TaxID=152316 RepID=A0A9P8ZWD1_9PEZI|nr:uncharacterized protein BKA67DRAFT_537680 [Truncatella angustata]KAH6651828.1 hypothetical protein BKA67DRAFT_537680 [Truncatella angustata]KAH8195242.1 hypothetical protein TruAng_010589 [Truncatella angustata]
MMEHKQVESHTPRGHMKSDSVTSQLERPASRYQLGKNFSYPRPDGNTIRHETSDSRSSVNSNGSVPGMTDSSDSDGSGDDDYHYNTSASRLWDSFWPTATEKEHPNQTASNVIDRPPQSTNSFSLDYCTATRDEDPEDDTVTITQSVQNASEARSNQWPLSKSSHLQPAPKLARNAVSYSVYPKPTPLPTRITLPPRTSSLTLEANLRPLKGSKSNGNISSRTSIPSLYLTPPPPITMTVTTQEPPRPAPEPPAGPPQRLRQATSAYSIRESLHFNATAPLVPMPPIPDQLRSAPPQIEHFVSVFEFDSETEDDGENTFAKRIARGLSHKKSAKELGSKKESHKGHKKSVSEKSALSPKKNSSVLDESSSLSRKRGGSLGRMLLFKK